MRKNIALVLVLSLLASLLAGCGGAETAETTSLRETQPMETTAEPTQAPTTEPALSAEEILYNSLPERMRQAADLGIVALSQLEDMERECTIEEAAGMLQAAYTQRHGTESRLMADVMGMECANEPAYLGWVGRLPIALYVEAMEPEAYKSYEQWVEHVLVLSRKSELADRIYPGNSTGGYSYLPDNDAILASNGYAWYDIGWTGGMGSYLYRNMPEGIELLDGCMGQGNLLAYSTYLFDHTTGHKVVEVSLYDEIPVEKILTVGDMAEMALRMYHAFYREAELAPYEECVTADPDILTAELLNRPTNLPDASCARLPAAWHGVTLDEKALTLEYTAEAGQYDWEVYEYEIQAIKDAGFNYIGLQLDFSWLQAGNWYSRKEPLDGQLDRTRLKTLDQILAWCMERDIHLDIRCTSAGGMIPGKQKRWSATDKAAVEYAKLWSVLAQRYSAVSNAYLSFTVQDSVLGAIRERGWFVSVADNMEGRTPQKTMVDFVRPAVDAIREATPDRCIIVDLSSFNVGTEVLELQVALSADLTSITNEFFVLLPEDTRILDPEHYLSVQWPCKEGCNAESLLRENQYWEDGSTVLRVMELAEENGLGFMFGGWGRVQALYRGAYYGTTRYPDETYEAFLKDMTDTMGKYGYGWCYEEWYGLNGITYSAPATKNAAYQQIGDYPMYYDTAMLGFFREINGVS